jgi:hypothetical protein
LRMVPCTIFQRLPPPGSGGGVKAGTIPFPMQTIRLQGDGTLAPCTLPNSNGICGGHRPSVIGVTGGWRLFHAGATERRGSARAWIGERGLAIPAAEGGRRCRRGR